MFRTIVLLINILALGFVIYMTIIEPPKRGEQIGVVIGIYIFILSNIWYVFVSNRNDQNNETWLSLYFKRKKLEERNKIKNLTQDEKNS